MQISDHDIEDAVLEGAKTYLTLQEHTKIGTVCGKCKDRSMQVMEKYLHEHFSK